MFADHASHSKYSAHSSVAGETPPLLDIRLYVKIVSQKSETWRLSSLVFGL